MLTSGHILPPPPPPPPPLPIINTNARTNARGKVPPTFAGKKGTTAWSDYDPVTWSYFIEIKLEMDGSYITDMAWTVPIMVNKSSCPPYLLTIKLLPYSVQSNTCTLILLFHFYFFCLVSQF